MPGPTIPGFYPQRGPMTEDEHYGPPTEEMLHPRPPLDVVPTDLWGGGRGPIDLSQPPQGDPGAMSARQYKVPAGKWFVDQVEDGIARVEDPEGNAMTMRAQPGWKEGMAIDPPKQPRKRLAVP